MALHVRTDAEFDRALEYLAKAEQRSKSDVVREAVLRCYRARTKGMEFGALQGLKTSRQTGAAIQREFEAIHREPDQA